MLLLKSILIPQVQFWYWGTVLNRSLWLYDTTTRTAVLLKASWMHRMTISKWTWGQMHKTLWAKSEMHFPLLKRCGYYMHSSSFTDHEICTNVHACSCFPKPSYISVIMFLNVIFFNLVWIVNNFIYIWVFVFCFSHVIMEYLSDAKRDRFRIQGLRIMLT